MRTPRARLTRREAALVAAALLLPIPLFAQSGLSVPLPDSVSRGLGSLVTVEVSDDGSGSTANGSVSENGSSTDRSGKGTLRIKRGFRRSLLVPDGVPTVPNLNGPEASDQPAGDSGSGGGNTPAGGEPGEDGGDAGSPGNPGSGSGGSGSGSGNGSGGDASAEPGVQIAVAGQGSSAGASATTGESGVDVTTENDGAPSAEPSSAGVEATNTGGSKAGVEVTVPGAGVGSPTLPPVP